MLQENKNCAHRKRQVASAALFFPSAKSCTHSMSAYKSEHTAHTCPRNVLNRGAHDWSCLSEFPRHKELESREMRRVDEIDRQSAWDVARGVWGTPSHLRNSREWLSSSFFWWRTCASPVAAVEAAPNQRNGQQQPFRARVSCSSKSGRVGCGECSTLTRSACAC
jgi:hypothetical protein